MQNFISSSRAFPLIVHCHLRWNFVWQRPQQFHSRLSKRHPVLFVEAPLVEDGDFDPYFTYETAPDHPNVTIFNTHFSSQSWERGAEYIDATRRSLLTDALCGPLLGKFEKAVQWFYDPMAVEAHLGHHKAIATVYDCMDELSQFKFAPPELIERERRLLRAAEVVFAGGRKMCESKSRYNSNCHFYGCGVDVAHFGKARGNSTETPADLQHLEGPILGYFGVVDERLDYELIAKLADARPDWHVVMVGPTAKVDASELPQRPNLHWMGGRDYSQLPAYTKAFDVCLMPFALNEATEYINPTKALEYMATATPVVSTPVPDVVSNFSNVCKIAREADQFIAYCDAQCVCPDRAMIERGLKMANENTWDAIVAKLEGHVLDALKPKTQPVHRPVKTASYASAAAA